MCLSNISKSKIAEEDITVYKCLSIQKIVDYRHVVTGNKYVAELFNGDKICGEIGICCGITFLYHNNLNYTNDFYEYNSKYKSCTVFGRQISKLYINHKNIIITGYVTPYRHVNVEIGKTYTAKISPKNERIEEGLHSFVNKRDCIISSKKDSVIVKCIIPKGSKYYSGDFVILGKKFYRTCDSIASEALKYVKIVPIEIISKK
jgi:hypothetical protein